MKNNPTNQKVSMEIKNVKQFISTLENMLVFMNRFLEQENALIAEPESNDEKLRELTELRILSKTGAWPEAIDESEIVGDNDEEKLHKAAAILNSLVTTDITDKKVLDFGCGEGHLCYVANNLFGTKKVAGYDIEEKKWTNFKKDPNLIYTTKWSEIIENGPYDVIVINDVLDHAQNFENSLKKINEIKSEAGRIFIRCHPWTSRHGCHTHTTLNKAFIHLVFTENELYEMGIKSLKTQAFLNPIKSYKKMFQSVGLTIMRENIIKHDVELFFAHNPRILRRIKEKWQKSDDQDLANGKKFPREIMEIEYVDFTLM